MKNEKDLHRVPLISARLTQEQYNWLITHAKSTQKPINAIVKEALNNYRKENS